MWNRNMYFITQLLLTSVEICSPTEHLLLIIPKMGQPTGRKSQRNRVAYKSFNQNEAKAFAGFFNPFARWPPMKVVDHNAFTKNT